MGGYVPYGAGGELLPRAALALLFSGRIKAGKIRVVDIKQTEVWDDTC